MKVTPKHAPKSVCRLPLPVGARVDFTQADAIALAEVLSYASRGSLGPQATRLHQQLAAVAEALDCDACTYSDRGPAYNLVRGRMDGGP